MFLLVWMVWMGCDGYEGNDWRTTRVEFCVFPYRRFSRSSTNKSDSWHPNFCIDFVFSSDRIRYTVYIYERYDRPSPGSSSLYTLVWTHHLEPLVGKTEQINGRRSHRICMQTTHHLQALQTTSQTSLHLQKESFQRQFLLFHPIQQLRPWNLFVSNVQSWKIRSRHRWFNQSSSQILS